MKIEDVANDSTKFETLALGDPLMRTLAVDDILQIERRGYYRVDKINTKLNEGDKTYELIYVPDGK